MENKEYLEKIKNIEKNSLIKSKEIQNNDYRQAKALEIIAEELIHTREFLTGLSILYKDLLIDVENLKKGGK